MAVEQKVVIKVEIDPDLGKSAAINTFLTQLDRKTKRTSSTLRVFDAGFKKFGVTVGKTTAKLMDFGKTLLKLNLKVFAVEIAAVTASMLAMKAALAVGSGFMKAWTNTVKFARAATAGLAASVVTLASSLAAAHRQFQQFQLAPFVGGLNQARTAMAGAMTAMPMYGQQASQVAAVLSKAGIQAGNVQAVVRQIGDMAAGDNKAFTNLAQAVANVQKTGSSAAGVQALQAMGPQFQKSAQQAGAMGGKEFINALQSGALTPEAFQGSVAALSTTLFGGVKEMITRLYVRLASMGEIFLDPLRNAMGEIENIVANGLFRISGAIRAFGLETFIPGFVNMLAKFTDWMVILINRDLPKLMGYFGAIRAWWGDFKEGTSNFFGRMSKGLRGYSDAASEAWGMTKNFFGSLGGGFGSRMSKWREGMEQNGQAFQQFGTNLGDVVVAGISVVARIGDLFFENLDKINNFLRFLADKVFPAIESFSGVFVQAFITALPWIQRIVDLLLPVISAFSGLVGMVSGAGGGLGSLAIVGGMAAGGRGIIGKVASKVGLGGMASKVGGGLLSAGLKIAPKMSSMGGAMALGGGAILGGGYLLNRGMQSETGAGGALQSAAGGAAIGAAFGGLPGAVIGGILGGAVGWFKGNKEKERQKKAGKELGNTLVTNLIDGFADMTPAEMQTEANRLRALAGDESRLDKMAKEQNVSQDALTASLNQNIQRLDSAIRINTNQYRTGQTRDRNKWSADYTTTGMVSTYMEGIMNDAKMGTQTFQTANNFEAGANTRGAMSSLLQFVENGGDLSSGEGSKLAAAAINEIEQEGINRGHRGTNLGRFVRDAGRGLVSASQAGGWNVNADQLSMLTTDLETIGTASDREFASSPLWNSIREMGELAGIKDMDQMLESAYNASNPDAAIASISAQVHSDAAKEIVNLKDAAKITAEEFASLADQLRSGFITTPEDVAQSQKVIEADRQLEAYWKQRQAGDTRIGNAGMAGLGLQGSAGQGYGAR